MCRPLRNSQAKYSTSHTRANETDTSDGVGSFDERLYDSTGTPSGSIARTSCTFLKGVTSDMRMRCEQTFDNDSLQSRTRIVLQSQGFSTALLLLCRLAAWDSSPPSCLARSVSSSPSSSFFRRLANSSAFFRVLPTLKTTSAVAAGKHWASGVIQRLARRFAAQLGL